MPRQARTLDALSISSLALEEEIIQSLRNQANEATDSMPLYEDPDFAPDVSSLYFDADHLPDYASRQRHEVYWYRPTEYAPDPDYFKTSSGCGLVREGVLNDAWLLGVFAAVALHPDNLIENLFVSESLTHFKQYGVYTCRFFKDNEWISVTTDTRIPYSMELEPQDKRLNATLSPSRGAVLYGSSKDPNEVFLPLLEKAYAKLHGTYQILDEKYGGGMGTSAGTSSGRILEAFLDCTGGSAHRVDLHSEAKPKGGTATSPSMLLWHQLLQYQKDHCIVTTQLRQYTPNAQDVTQMGILKNRQYIVQHVTEVKDETALDVASPPCLRLVKLQTVWARGMWQGAWSPDDSQWDDNPHVAHALRSDPRCAFSRAGTDGCFWMAWEDVLETFTELFVVHVFHPDVQHQYCVRGDWVGPSAAGGPVKRPVGPVEPKPGATAGAPETSIDKTEWKWVHDADPNWHRNPQYTLSVPLEGHQEGIKRDKKVRTVLVSLTQRDFRLYGGDNYAINFVLLGTQQRVATHEDPCPLWEFKRRHVVAEAHSSDADATMGTLAGTVPTGVGTASTSTLPMKTLPERELVHKDVHLSSGTLYYLVPYTTSPMVEMEFYLRVVASHPLRLERVPPILSVIRTGEWRAEDRKSTDRILTTSASAGGPLLLVPWPQAHVAGTENAAWCQNPQFWVRFADRSPRERAKLRALVATKAYVTLKLVLRKTFARTLMSKARQREASKEGAHTIGITALRTTSTGSVLVGAGRAAATQRRTPGPPLKTNFLGEPIASSKAGTSAVRTNLVHGTKSRHNQLEKVASEDLSDDEDRAAAPSSVLPSTFPSPKLVVTPTEWCRLSSYTSPVVACLYLRKVPKEWLFALDAANAVGGLLIVPTMSEVGVPGSFELQVDSDFPLLVDELPRGTRAVQSLPGEWTETQSGGCHLHPKWRQNPSFDLEIQGTQATKVRITLSRSEREWKAQCQRDPVGTMIGFYVFPKGSGTFSGSEHKSVPLDTLKVNGRAWSATDFVPLHTVTSPPDLVLSPASKSGYVIIPTTHEPGKVGKFVLSVECTTDFTLGRGVA